MTKEETCKKYLRVNEIARARNTRRSFSIAEISFICHRSHENESEKCLRDIKIIHE